MAWLFVAHAMSRAPIAAAPRMTSAYSAVVCPTSARTARTNRRSIGFLLGIWSTGEALDAREAGQQRRDHREQPERGQDHEHEGEQQAHGHSDGVRFGVAAQLGALLGGEAGG